MSKLCDRSPCDSLLETLGHTIFGSTEGFYITALSAEEPVEVQIDYCPFCGTRLEEVPNVVVEKFMRPRRRRNHAPAVQG